MKTPFNAETAYAIAGLCLFATGHWFFGLISLGMALYANHFDRKASERSEPHPVAAQASPSAAPSSNSNPAPDPASDWLAS